MNAADRSIARSAPRQTKLVICVVHAFSEWRPAPAFAQSIRERWPELHLVELTSYDALPPHLPDMDILVSPSLRPEQLARAVRLKWIHCTAAGVSQLMHPELRASGVTVTNAGGIFSVPMAEHSIGLLLALARNFPDSVRYQDQTTWAQQSLWDKPQHLAELNGRLLLIVGLGSIGRELARRAKAFDMRVWGVTRSGRGDATCAERILPAAQLHQALPHADYVVIAAPETPATRHIIGAEQLALMKHGARLINIARGSLLDETALCAALSSGKLAGAALDVTDKEPLPPASPLWKTPNLFLTPHTSAVSDRLWQRETELFLRLLEEWFSGKDLSNRVDLARGY